MGPLHTNIYPHTFGLIVVYCGQLSNVFTTLLSTHSLFLLQWVGLQGVRLL